jgi:hypothetical protein
MASSSRQPDLRRPGGTGDVFVYACTHLPHRQRMHGRPPMTSPAGDLSSRRRITIGPSWRAQRVMIRGDVISRQR